MPAGAPCIAATRWPCSPGLHHERATDPRIGELLESRGLGNRRDPESAEAANVRELRRGYDRRTRLPRTLVEELARTTSMAQSEWVEARPRATSAASGPGSRTSSRSSGRSPRCLGSARAVGYDPLLDEYEPGARSADLAVLFDALRTSWRRWSRRSSRRRRDAPTTRGSILNRSYPLDRQRVFGEAVAAAVGLRLPARAARRDGATRSAPASGPATAGSPRASTSTSSATPSSASSTRSATASTSRACDAPTRHADGRGGLAGDARVAVAALGEPRRPRPGLLGVLAARWPAASSTRRSPTSPSTTSTPPSTASRRR